MSNKKISQLASATDVTANDLIQIVDVEDGVMAPSGTNKKATASLLANQLVPLINAGSIAGSKVSPNFGAQNITTTGTITAGIGSVISGSGAEDALRITQTGSGNALVIEDSTSTDNTPLVIDTSGKIVAGYTSAILNAGSEVSPRIQIHGLGGGTSTSAITSWNLGVTNSSNLILSRSDSGIIGTHGLVDDEDQFGRLTYTGSDGVEFIEAAVISAVADGNPGVGNMPGRIVFSTTPSGSGTPIEALRITSGQGIKIAKVSVTSPLVSDGNVFSGTYTPTLTNVTNLDSSTAFSCQYMRVGNVVTVSGRVEMDPLATGNTELRMSIPIASDFSLTTHCGGAFSSFNSNNGSIRADSATNEVFFGFLSNTTSNTSFHFTFTYRVI